MGLMGIVEKQLAKVLLSLSSRFTKIETLMTIMKYNQSY